MDNYKSNSHKSREQNAAINNSENEATSEKVVSGPTTVRKKGGIQKIIDMFVAEDFDSVKAYIISDFIIPGIKKAIVSTVDIILNGNTDRSRNNSNVSRVSYRSYYEPKNDRREYSSKSRDSFDYDEILFTNRGDAEIVLEQMDELIERFQTVRVFDMYDLAKITPPYTSSNYGWKDIRSAKVVPVRGGYVIKMPRPMLLD